MSSIFDDEEEEHSHQSLIERQSSVGGGSDKGEDNTPTNPSNGSGAASDGASRSIYRTKLYMALVLTVLATVIAILTHRYASSLDKSKFEQQFQDDAQEIIKISQNNAFKAFSTLEDFSRTITSLGNFKAGNESFPLLTIPDFEIRAKYFQEMTGSSWMTFIPLVDEETRSAYENYTLENQGWVQKVYEASSNLTINMPHPVPGSIWRFLPNNDPETSEVAPFVIAPDLYNMPPPGESLHPYYPLWQTYPAYEAVGIPMSTWVGFNLISLPDYVVPISSTTQNRHPIMEAMLFESIFTVTPEGQVPTPESIVFQPIFERNNDPTADIVGFLMVYLPWDAFFQNILSDSGYNLIVEVENTCDQTASFLLEGSKVTTLPRAVEAEQPGNETESSSADDQDESSSDEEHDDHHENVPYIDGRYVVKSEFAEFTRCSGNYCDSACDFQIHIFPHQNMEGVFQSSTPVFLTIAVVVLFAFTSVVLFLYDYLIQRRNGKVIDTAKKNNAIVARLFPSQVHDRLMNQAEMGGASAARKRTSGSVMAVIPSGARFKLHSFLTTSSSNGPSDDRPGHPQGDSLADFFPECTVMFGDIKGFTAWSSVRDPVQVFTLLETIYGAFDKLCKKRKILKVESVKDSYLAVCGVPTPREDHAVALCRFASDCNDQMNRLVQYLEKMLGPDTSALSMRFGVHSGAVTAGVLRGVQKARFQLFGDTVNTAARMESTGEARRVHASEATAQLLRQRGKGHWLAPRESAVEAKGKGRLQTYWVTPKATDASSTASGRTSDASSWGFDQHLHSSTSTSAKSRLNGKLQRIVEWNTELLLRLLKQVVARRNATTFPGKGSGPARGIKRLPGANVIDEMTEAVRLPRYKASKAPVNANAIELPLEVEQQLEDYVATVASMYHANHFHCYEHASHVTMSVSKMMSRIVAPEIETAVSEDMEANEYEAKLHDHTYGLTSDPITQFAIVLSALIHDVDHPGVPNATLVKEGTEEAVKYKNKSVAEQHSVDLAWDLLMSDKYKKLCGCIYKTQAELERLRQWVVTAVMSTDIVDKDLKKLRNARWDRAFSDETTTRATSTLDRNIKATIVVEHIIQASDVSHTMQHWHVYLKWNERLFQEMYQAYKEGRSDTDPSTFWYQGELGFFDYYIIPLAKKLKECGVFGVSSDEYLDYALANRREWEARGQDVVKRYVHTHADADADETTTPNRRASLDGTEDDGVEC
ncbi:Receptor-type guanylate cyclase gcy [Seminavis robusta]|uniref:Receptor-type guanylate cyclase gcy n=1 Tax=Seminavis robusta TaxID=568900 RepID=A0A9N8HL77_9STRA|nr:Receptor-type guanylate cyclase gcy [Seminavis robusta]|eukprot:Sro894_g217120.1 Receptor-type guanylate cyclase gcy (1217) ;mRNA; f:14995-19709